MLVIDSDKRTIPANIIAGNPTAKIFNAGAVRVITPKPIFIKSNDAISGNPIKIAPKNIIALHSMVSFNKPCRSSAELIGKSSKLSKSKLITKTCPPSPKNISVEQMTKNCAITGTFPMLGSTIFAILKPIEADTACPPIIKAALTICNKIPIKTPTNT